MGGMKELWEQRQQQLAYPHKPGWKDPGISRENAERIEKSGALSNNMKAVLALFEQGFEGTADEVAERLEKSPFAIRPACTHLRSWTRSSARRSAALEQEAARRPSFVSRGTNEQGLSVRGTDQLLAPARKKHGS